MRSVHRALPASAYPFSTQIDIRLTDLDFAQHVNNAAVAALHEEVRVRFHLEYFDNDSVFARTAGGGVVARIEIDYLREISYGGAITGCAAIARLGKSSYTMAQALFQSGYCVSEATCVIAMRRNGVASPLSDELRGRLGRAALAAASGDGA